LTKKGPSIVSSRKQQYEKCAEIKIRLAEKYERLAKSVNSIPRSQKHLRRAKGYRREAADLLRM
jgi:hypothetical protein